VGIEHRRAGGAVRLLALVLLGKTARFYITSY
jgi:hypothetical protein